MLTGCVNKNTEIILTQEKEQTINTFVKDNFKHEVFSEETDINTEGGSTLHEIITDLNSEVIINNGNYFVVEPNEFGDIEDIWSNLAIEVDGEFIVIPHDCTSITTLNDFHGIEFMRYTTELFGTTTPEYTYIIDVSNAKEDVSIYNSLYLTHFNGNNKTEYNPDMHDKLVYHSGTKIIDTVHLYNLD